MDRRKTYDISLMGSDEVYDLLDSVECDELDTDIEGNFSDDSMEDPDYVPLKRASNVFNINNNNTCLDAIQSEIEPNHSQANIEGVEEVEISIPGSSCELDPSGSEFTNNFGGNQDGFQINAPSNNNIDYLNATIQNEVPSQSKIPRVENAPSLFHGSPHEIDPKGLEFKNILWRKKNLQLHKKQIEFKGTEKLPEHLYQLKTPFQCFKYFADDALFKHIANETNLYARQANISTNFVTTAKEIQTYMGILFYMSIYKYPNVREYWAENSFEPIRRAMTRNRFEEIRRYLHFNDNTKMLQKGHPQFDPLFKVRPIIDHFNSRFRSIPMCQRLCVDEQMCATKMASHLRQYMPAKPHKWGMKLFVICDSYGYSYGFELYSGASSNLTPQGAPDLGAAANVVSRLSQIIPNHQNHIIYFDNFYTTLPLMVYLYSRGIYSLGTLRVNRIGNCKLPTDKEVANKPRGYSTEFVGSSYGVDLSTTLWKDNKCVRLASTYVGVLPFKTDDMTHGTSKAVRFDRASKQRIEVNCPTIIHEYNAHMGGVDLMDGLLGRYHIRMKTTKWTSRFFYHLMDLAMINGYLLHKRLNRNPKESYIKLPIFRKQVAAILCEYEASDSKKKSVGRPRSTGTSESSKRKTYLPLADVRFDGYGHFPEWLDRFGKRQCKLPGCKSETQCACSKCKINLCCSVAKNCFYEFHKN